MADPDAAHPSSPDPVRRTRRDARRAALVEIEAYSDVLSFTLNGEPVTLENPDPTTLLVEFLPSPEVDLTGTKLVCGEGGLANTVLFAIKHAILAARADFGVTSWFELDTAATVERIQQACMLEDAGTP